MVGALGFPLVRVPLMMLIESWAGMLATWPLLAFDCPGSRAVRDHRYSSGLAGLAILHGRDAGSRIGWPSQDLYWSGIGWLVWVPSSYLIRLVEAAPGWRLKVVGRLMRQTGVENIYRTDRHGDVEFVTNGRDLWVNTDR